MVCQFDISLKGVLNFPVLFVSLLFFRGVADEGSTGAFRHVHPESRHVALYKPAHSASLDGIS